MWSRLFLLLATLISLRTRVFAYSIYNVTKQPKFTSDYDLEGNYNQSQAFHNWLTRTMMMYDNTVRPGSGEKECFLFLAKLHSHCAPSADGPLKIALGLDLIGISSINKANTEITLEMFFHETWTDHRLRYDVAELGVNPLTLPLDAVRYLWIPDTNFLNAVHALNPMEGSVSHLYYMKLYANSTLQYSRRLSITASCEMDLTMYPFDQQACTATISSYGWTVEDIVYAWSLVPTVPIDKIALPDFYVTHYASNVVNTTFVAGVYSVPQLCIGLKRRAGFCFVQIFIPAASVVASSWVSLWVETASHFADIISIIAAIIFLSYSYNSVMPKVSYVKVHSAYLSDAKQHQDNEYDGQSNVDNRIPSKSITHTFTVHSSSSKLNRGGSMYSSYSYIQHRYQGTGASLPRNRRIIGMEAMDVYLAACFLFALLSLIKLAMIKYMHRRIHRRREKLQGALFPLVTLCNAVNEQLPLLGPARGSLAGDDTQYSSAPLALRKAMAAVARKPSAGSNVDVEYDDNGNESDEYRTDELHDTFWKFSKMVHVSCQLLLPLAFGIFGIFYFAVYPNFPSTRSCEM